MLLFSVELLGLIRSQHTKTLLSRFFPLRELIIPYTRAAALKVLGYTGKEIEKALEKVDANLSVEDIIRKGLLNLAR